MSETAPHDSKPNFEPQFDIVRRLLDEQAIHDTCDDIERISRAVSTIDVLNRELADKAILASLRVSKWLLEFDGYEQLVIAASQGESGATTKGYVGMVNYGIQLGTPGYVIHLINPDSKSIHPYYPDNDPVHVGSLIPVSNILGYEYLPVEV